MSHEIRVDRERLLVDVALGGFFSPEEAMRATEAVRAAVRALGRDAGRHLTLYDVTEVDIAPGPTIDQLKAAYLDPSIRHLWARKVAYVSPSTLARMQLKRLREERAQR